MYNSWEDIADIMCSPVKLCYQIDKDRFCILPLIVSYSKLLRLSIATITLGGALQKG